MPLDEVQRVSTHHCCYFSSSVVIDASKHERWQEEKQGAGTCVNEVLQEDKNKDHSSELVMLYKTGITCDLNQQQWNVEHRMFSVPGSFGQC